MFVCKKICQKIYWTRRRRKGLIDWKLLAMKIHFSLQLFVFLSFEGYHQQLMVELGGSHHNIEAQLKVAYLLFLILEAFI